MLRYFRYLRNKYILTLLVFGVYMLFLDDADIFSIIRQKIKLNGLVQEKERIQEKLDNTLFTLNQLNNIEAIEKFAREEKMFKRDDEDIFIIIED